MLKTLLACFRVTCDHSSVHQLCSTTHNWWRRREEKEIKRRKVEKMVEMVEMVEMEDDPAVTYSAPRCCGAADCWLTMVGGGVWKTGHERMSTSVCTEERTSEI